MMRAIDWHHTLFSLYCHNSHEETKLECSEEHSCCTICGTARGKFTRTGSSSNKIGHVNATTRYAGRTNGHMNESNKSREELFS